MGRRSCCLSVETLMDGLVVVAVLVGAALALWGCTVAATAYAIWTFVWKPWRVVRTDMKALAEQVNAAVALVQRERVLTLTDEEVAHRERRVAARQAARGGAP